MPPRRRGPAVIIMVFESTLDSVDSSWWESVIVDWDQRYSGRYFGTASDGHVVEPEFLGGDTIAHDVTRGEERDQMPGSELRNLVYHGDVLKRIIIKPYLHRFLKCTCNYLLQV